MRKVLFAFIVMACVLYGVNAQEWTPRVRPGMEMQEMQNSLNHMEGIFKGRLHPQDLAECIWDSMTRTDRAKIPGIATAKSVYCANGYEDMYFTVLSILQPAKGAPVSLTTSWRLVRANRLGAYQVSFYGTARQRDRIGVEMYFWCDEAASFPPPGKVALVRTLFDKLMDVEARPDYLSIKPTLERSVDATGHASWQPVRPGDRSPEQLMALVRSWRQSPAAGPHYIGITTSPYHDAILWVDDGMSLWGFLWRNEQNHWLLSDWCQSVSEAQDMSIGRVRLCTLPARAPVLPAVGGMGTVIQLSDLQSATGQLLMKLFRFAKLNNQTECFNYMAAAVSKQQRLDWWQQDQPILESIDLAKIRTVQQRDGSVLVSYPRGVTVRELMCKVLPTRILITQIRSRHASPNRQGSRPLVERGPELTAIERCIARAKAGKRGIIAPGSEESVESFNRWAAAHRDFERFSVKASADWYPGEYELTWVSRMNQGYAAVHCWYTPKPDDARVLTAFNVTYGATAEEVVGIPSGSSESVEARVQRFGDQVIRAAKQGNARQHFPSALEEYDVAHSELLVWANRSSGQFSARRVHVCDDHTCALLLQEKIAAKHLVVALFIDYKTMQIYNIYISNFATKTAADEFMRHPALP